MILESVKLFEEGTEQFDYITILAIQYLQDTSTEISELASIVIKNTLEHMPKVIAHFEKFALQNDFKDSVTKKVSVVLDELLNNIISYAFKDEEDHDITVRFQLKYLRLIITVEDDGIPFNPFRNDPPDVKLSILERKLGGLGIHIVKNLVDEYHYIRQSNKNIISLIKYDINSD